MVVATKCLATSKQIDRNERFLWDLVGLVLSQNSTDFFSLSPVSAALRQYVVNMLEEGVPDDALPKCPATAEEAPVVLPREELSEKTLLDLANKGVLRDVTSNVGRWIEAVMLSRYVNPLMYGKITDMYLEKCGCRHPLQTLLLLNQCGAAKTFELMKSCNIDSDWPKHLAFLLRNIEFCSKTALGEFVDILCGRLKDV